MLDGYVLLLASALWIAIGTSCNTWFGIGKDVEKAGENMQDAARSSQTRSNVPAQRKRCAEHQLTCRSLIGWNQRSQR